MAGVAPAVLCADRDILIDGFQFRAGRVIFRLRHDVIQRFGGQLNAQIAGLSGEIPMVDIGQRHHRQQDEDHRTEAAAPGAQQTAHLRFVGGFRRAVVAHRSAPGHAVEKHSADADEDVEEIEVPQMIHIEGVEKTLVRRPRHQHRHHFVAPGESVENVGDDDDVHRVTEQTLDAVRDHDGDLSAGKGDPQSQTEKHGHDQSEDRAMPSEEIEKDGQVEKIDQKPRPHRGKDRIVDDSGNELDDRRGHPQGFAVPDLEKLPHRHTSGLPETVGAESDQA